MTVGPMISKIFEYCLLRNLNLICTLANYSMDLRRRVVVHMLYSLSLKLVVDYYVRNGSNVYVASLYASKALDRVNHVKLFQKLIKK